MNEGSAPTKPATRSIWPIVAGLLVIVVIVGVTIVRRERAPVPAGASVAPKSVASFATPRATMPAHASQARPRFSLEERRLRRKAAQLEQERKGREFHDTLGARYAAEPIDAAWAAAKEAKLLAASATDEMRRVGAIPGNYRASCRSSVCKIGADFQDRGAAQDWLTLFSTGAGGELPNEAYVVSQNPDGSFHLEVLGLARK